MLIFNRELGSVSAGLTINKEELREKVRKAAAASECRAVEELMCANKRHHDMCDKLHTYEAA